MNNEKLRLLESWKNNLFSEMSISEIMKKRGKKTKPWVFNSLKHLVKNKLLISKKKGNMNFYSLNLDNPLLIQTFHYLEIQNYFSFNRLDVIVEMINSIPVKNYCLLIFGSYANWKQTKKSDLDICFLVENKQMEKRIRSYFSNVKMNYSIKIDEHYITFDDFVKMLLGDEENLGKQIFRNHGLFFNPDIYYQLIKEAYKNGFRP